LRRAGIYANQDQGDLALADINQALELRPHAAYVYVSRGDFYAEQANAEAALADYEAALELDPQDSAAYSSRGVLYARQGQPELALVELNQALALDPLDAWAYLTRASVSLDLQDYASAINDANYVIELEPLYAALAYSLLGDVHQQTGDSSAALSDYARALEQDPALVPAHISRGQLYYALGDIESALDDARQIIDLAPGQPDGYMLRALGRAAKADYAGVIADTAQVIELEPGNALAYTCRGQAFAGQENYDAALRDLNRAVELDPALREAYSNRYLVLEELGRYDEALADLDTLLELTQDPDQIQAVEQEIVRVTHIELAITLQELPEGFVESSPGELGLAMPDLGRELLLLSQFAFVNEDDFEIIVGFVAEFNDPEDLEAFDEDLDNLSELALSVVGLARGDATTRLLRGLNNVGDDSGGVTFVVTTEDTNRRMDVVMFRRGEMVAFVYVVYLDRTVPVIPFGEISQRLDERVQTFQAGE
jgi:tetratricopeptide (TPR) repeat protein